MRAIHHPFGRHASQHPTQFWNFWDIGLTIKRHPRRIEPASEPRRGDLKPRPGNTLWVFAFNECVVVR